MEGRWNSRYGGRTIMRVAVVVSGTVMVMVTVMVLVTVAVEFE